jgi:hypothetical protein
MGKVFGLHLIELRPGIRREEFERFVPNRFLPLAVFPGWNVRLLKGDRGERTGEYAFLVEIESVQVRDRYAPDGGLSAEAQAFQAQQPESYRRVWEELGTYTTTQLGIDDAFTDYVELAANYP